MEKKDYYNLNLQYHSSRLRGSPSFHLLFYRKTLDDVPPAMNLEKYDYNLPHLEDQVINRYIKDIGKDAGLTEMVEIEKTQGGKAQMQRIEKYKLIHTHTARRTGATLMYLSGMDIYDIMKITGHSSPAMLKKYIKADQLEVASKIEDKYDYFK